MYTEGKTPFAKGATADLYAIDESKIFKCFHADKPDSSIDNEYDCSKKIEKYNLGSPKIYERIQNGNERGFIMEYIHGKNMLDEMFTHIDACEELMHSWINLHYRVNSIHTTEFADAHQIFTNRISWSSQLSVEEKKETLSLLDSLPKGNCLCHTDLHPGNIMITDSGLRIIDWCDVMNDSPLSDVARTMLLFTIVDFPSEIDREKAKTFLNLGQEMFLSEYRKLYSFSNEELNNWIVILAAARLDSESEGNRKALYNIVKNGGLLK